MNKETLLRYVRCEANRQQEAEVLEWVRENPSHAKELDALRMIHHAMIFHAPEPAAEQKKGRLMLLGTSLRSRLIRAAAVVAVCAGLSYWFVDYRLSQWGRQEQTLVAAAGTRLSHTLADGTKIWLNSGSKLIYPSIFAGSKRVVYVEGEALFDVARDASKPFVVKTFACEVNVLGTKFNVQANEKSNLFSTALLRGSVQVVTEDMDEKYVLSPGDLIRLENGHLHLYKEQERIEDETLWVDGILNLRGYDFIELMERFETTFDVRIVDACKKIDPDVKYQRGKIWTSEGVEHALRLLQQAYDFSYTWDREQNIITVTDK